MIVGHRAKYQRFLRLLIESRKARGITQMELAKALGIEQSLISKCERGVRRLDFVEVLAILDALSIEPMKFFRELRKGKDS